MARKALGAAPSGTSDVATKGYADGIGTPPAAVVCYAGSSAPTGWLLCFGQAVSRTTYAALFTAISTTYGTGDGSTTFNVPDLRGRAVAGKDDMGGSAASRLTGTSGSVAGTTLGASGGEQTHQLSQAEMPSHAHTLTNVSSTITAGGSSVGLTTSSATRPAPTVGSTGSDGAHNNVQPTIILNYIIKT